MEKKDFSKLMDQVIERKLLEGNCAQDPKKSVRIMVCADFEDSCVPEEKVSDGLLHTFVTWCSNGGLRSNDRERFDRFVFDPPLTLCSALVLLVAQASTALTCLHSP